MYGKKIRGHYAADTRNPHADGRTDSPRPPAPETDSHATLVSIEKGVPTVSIGAYAAVLHALNNMDSDLLLVAKDDELGRKLQDLTLPTRKRAPKKGE